MNGVNLPMEATTSRAELDRETVAKMVQLSASMKLRSYCPYSKFPVGAALLCEDGTVYTGCNVENGSLQLVICAERTAIVKAVSEGHRKFKAIFITSNMADEYIVPCGACRQFLTEFGTDWDVYMTKPNGTFLRMTVDELCPHSVAPTAMLARMRDNCCQTKERKGAQSPFLSAGPAIRDPVQEVIES